MKRLVLVVATVVGVAALVGAGGLVSAAQSDYDDAAEAREEAKDAAAERRRAEREQRAAEARYEHVANQNDRIERALIDLELHARAIVVSNAAYVRAGNALVGPVNEVIDAGGNQPVADEPALVAALDDALRALLDDATAVHNAYVALEATR